MSIFNRPVWNIHGWLGLLLVFLLGGVTAHTLRTGWTFIRAQPWTLHSYRAAEIPLWLGKSQHGLLCQDCMYYMVRYGCRICTWSGEATRWESIVRQVHWLRSLPFPLVEWDHQQFYLAEWCFRLCPALGETHPESVIFGQSGWPVSQIRRLDLCWWLALWLGRAKGCTSRSSLLTTGASSYILRFSGEAGLVFYPEGSQTQLQARPTPWLVTSAVIFSHLDLLVWSLFWQGWLSGMQSLCHDYCEFCFILHD